MSKEINEAKDKIQDLKEFFIRECKYGLWREYSGERYINKYFEISHTLNSLTDKRQWLIIFGREKISCQDINISQIYFYFLRLFIKQSARNDEKNNRKIQIGKISERFFNEHKELKRDNKLDKLLN